MNKTELIAAMAEKTGSTKKDAEATLNAMHDCEHHRSACCRR